MFITLADFDIRWGVLAKESEKKKQKKKNKGGGGGGEGCSRGLGHI